MSAAAKLMQAFALPFDQHRENYLAQWRRAERSPDDGKSFLQHVGDGGTVLRLSHRVLLAHEDKTFQGAMVASLSTPWGESKTDKDAGGYHLVWTRDLVQSASALLAVGETAVPLRALLWLTCIQNPDGSFPQNSWIDGSPYWQGIQLDEMAAPMLLAWRLWKVAPEAFEGARFRPVLLRALAYLLAAGPVTAQDPLGGKRRLFALDDCHDHRRVLRRGGHCTALRARAGRGLRAGLRRLAQRARRGLVRDQPGRDLARQNAPLRPHHACRS